MKSWLRKTRALRLLIALGLIAAGFATPTAQAGTFVPFNCWDGVVEQGTWTAYEYDCATVNVGEETEEAVPAEAQPRVIHDRVCRTHHRSTESGTQTKYRTFCIAVNEKQVDVSFDGKFEALLSWEHAPYQQTHIAVQIDWVRLINSVNGNVLKYKNNVGWLTCDSSCSPDAYGTSHDSWFAAGCDGAIHHLYAKARYRIKWLDLPGDPIGTYKTMQSTVWVGDC